MDPQTRQSIINDFIEYCKKRLQIQGEPNIEFVEDRDWAVKKHSFGSYNHEKNSIRVYTTNRNLADILRTLAHELVHEKQREVGKIKDGSAGETGSDVENEANALAGVLMRDYGKINDLIYESRVITLKEIYELQREIDRIKK